MQTIRQFLDYSETTFAAYAQGLIADDDNIESFKVAKFIEAQAFKFQSNGSVRAQPSVQLNGSSATLFQEKSTGEKILAVRGTENSVADYLTDIVDVGLHGSAANMPQYIALNNIYQSLIANDQLSSAKVFNLRVTAYAGF
jgi:hypothetical protein